MDSRISVLIGLSLRISIDERADHALVTHLLLLRLPFEEINALLPALLALFTTAAAKLRAKPTAKINPFSIGKTALDSRA
jgi:hypothetical protein